MILFHEYNEESKIRLLPFPILNTFTKIIVINVIESVNIKYQSDVEKITFICNKEPGIVLNN